MKLRLRYRGHMGRRRISKCKCPHDVRRSFSGHGIRTLNSKPKTMASSCKFPALVGAI
ncbi:hypothetical protein ASPFODRAFT_281905 [Aspergillus luchuensis CBS 106.47]|uniref:Uncharacterized protein n=1 Tax=Aspergillus luchuensis (strain CBS 106.47) TaxID=1137211 RepID=A0A1M3TA04_ASPLC|nr:hypothetical protein ASPFODRAFT_281905 [Aspergillus luchuensis CBS 106.47]